MNKIGRRILALGLCLIMVLSIFSACSYGSNTPTTEPAATQSPKEARVLKVLTLGHSLAVDCGHMLAMIAAKEGYEELKVGTLYYSGCPLNKHVEFMTKNSPEYKLYISSTEDPDTPPTIMESITMRDAITFDYWDIIVMQGGVFEIATDSMYKCGDIQKIQDFVNEYKRNPTAIFAWHMPWAPPTDNTLRDRYTAGSNIYYSEYAKYGDDRSTLFNAITKCVSDNILTDDTFKFMIPTGTAMENALSSYLEEVDLHRDYAHASDLGRVIASYVWYCKLTGIDQLDQIKLDVIPRQFFKSTAGTEDRVLTESEKAIILESVNNALAQPLQMTPSQYTEAPAQ